MKLQQLQIFQNLTEEELEKSLVCSQAVVKKYPKDTYIFRQGDVPLKLYFILEGMVELGSINLNGKITRSSYVTVGEEFGEVEMFLRQSAYSGYAKAKMKCRFWRFHRISLAEDAKETVYITVRLCSICFSFLRKKQRNVTVR